MRLTKYVYILSLEIRFDINVLTIGPPFTPSRPVQRVSILHEPI
jgi:hypothetical protein